MRASATRTKTCTDLAAVLNASAVCPAEVLEQVTMETVRNISDRYQLELTVFKKECFGMGD